MNANTNIVVSNIRFPKDDWLQLKSVANSRGMSVNEYLIYLTNMDSINMITGNASESTEKKGYEALEDLKGLVSKYKGKPMGASEEDKIIYDID